MSTTTKGKATTHRLLYETGNTDIGKSKSLVFGHMVQLAVPVLKAYHSDLFHDAICLNEAMSANPGGLEFFYSFNEAGTSFSFSRLAMREHGYRLTVSVTDGTTRLRVERL